MSVLRRAFSFFASQFAYKYAFGKIRQKAVLVYLRLLQVTRRSLIMAVLVFFTLQLMVFGFIGSVVAAVWLCAVETETKLILLLSIFGVCFLVPLGILVMIFSERFWLRASGAVEMLASQNEK
jgi:hypothetical protein